MKSLVYLVFLVNYALAEFECPIVNTVYGDVRGQLKSSRNNRSYCSFTGIPFAKPPVGSLRFANPQPPESWSGVLNATEYSPRCAQRNYIFFQNPPVSGSEDCLYLNIYVPVTKNNTNKCQFPVMASIFWGGFFAGGSDDGYADPLYFMDYDVILVSFNYRLGIFGLLSTLDDEAPGNVGLKDQVLALQFIQENIGYFGGIRENVTIFGQSSGAASVHLHMISPASEGLFSNAISQSGTAITFLSSQNNVVQEQVIQVQAQLVNCSEAIGNNKKLIECFRNVSVDVLLESQDAFKTFHRYPFTPWLLVIESESPGNPNPFLTKNYFEYVNSGEFKKVPWLTGVVNREGLLFAASLITVKEETEDLNKNFSDTVASIASLNAVTNDSDSLYQNLSQFYLGGKNTLNVSDEASLDGFIDLFSDRYFTYFLYKSIKLQVKNGHDSIYLYSFEYSGEYTYASYLSTEKDNYKFNLGAAHCDDLLYQFYSPELFDEIKEPIDITLSDIWLRFWVNFATYGNPNPSENVVVQDIDWQTIKPNLHHCLKNDEILLLNVTGSYKSGLLLNMTNGFYKERMSFWEKSNIYQNIN